MKANTVQAEVLLGKKKTLSDKIRENKALIIMVLPAVVWIFIFCYIPIPGLVVAFKEVNYAKGAFGGDWIGLLNFRFLFQSVDTPIIIRNTLYYGIIGVVATPVCGCLSAMLLNELTNRRTAKLYQSIMFLPYFFSMVIVSYIAYAFLNDKYGMLNRFLGYFGIQGKDWYMYRPVWPFLIPLVGMWKGLGYQTVVYLATITGIDGELYDAAVIDGANKLQQAKYITIPHLRTIVTILLIMSVGSVLNSDFGLFYQLPRDQGALYPVTQVIDTYVFRALRTSGDIGISSAVGFLKSIVGSILVIGTNLIVRKIDPDSALF